MAARRIRVVARILLLLLPALLLPVAIPILIAAVETTSHALGQSAEVANWYRLLVVCDIIFISAGLMLFEFVMED